MQNGIRFIHVRVFCHVNGGWAVRARGGVTVAVEEVVAGGAYGKTGGWRAGAALCSPKENFCKRTGRRIAGGRLRTCNVRLSQECDFDDCFGRLVFVEAAVQAVFGDRLPRWWAEYRFTGFVPQAGSRGVVMMVRG